MSAWNNKEGFSEEKIPELIPEGRILVERREEGRIFNIKQHVKRPCDKWQENDQKSTEASVADTERIKGSVVQDKAGDR